jgi:hypothetical protein
VPFAVRKRGGRKLVLTPDGTDLSIAPRHRVGNAMVKDLRLWITDQAQHGSIEDQAGALNEPFDFM